MTQRLIVALVAIAAACSPKPRTEQAPPTAPAVTSAAFGVLSDSTRVTRYTMKNKKGMEVSVINYGGIITSILAPDRNGLLEEVTLGYDSLKEYENKNQYFGALIGRYGNRIAKGKFRLDGKSYSLTQNDGANHLHGGKMGFDKVFWDIKVQSSDDNPAITLTYRSPDGEEGYPGNLDVEVGYTLTEENEIRIEYRASTDKKTVINLTQHTYFNLAGNIKREILDHQLTLAADQFLPVDKTLIPTGKLMPVAGTPFDFNSPTAIGARISGDHEQLKFGIGYDHCWVLSEKSDSLKKAATAYEPVSGRQMETFTTEPAIQFYSGNFLNDKIAGRGGVVYHQRTGLCLETQHYPDSPNEPSFPSVVLNPGQAYHTVTVYRFSSR